MLRKFNRSFTTKLSIWIIAAFITLFLSSISTSKILPIANASDHNIDSASKWPHEKSDLHPDPALVFGRLPNNFRYVLMENHDPKDRVSMHLNVQTGSIHESDQQQGLAHFLEHMLFCGSTHFKPGELVKYFQSIGMQFGPDANAHTGFYETVYDILLPEGSMKSLETGLLVMKDYADGALLLQSEIDRERKVILAEKRTRDSASYRTFVSSLKFEFPDARISKRLPIGREDVIKNANHKLLKDFYGTWYRPENMVLVIVGDFDSKLAASLIEEKFSTLSARAPARRKPDTGKIEHKGIKAFYHFEKEAGKTRVSIEVVKMPAQDYDSSAFKKRMLVQNMADRIVQYRLDEMVSKADTPFTSASMESGIYLNQIEYAEITAECNPEDWEKTLFTLEQTLRTTLKYGFTESELERVKKVFLADLDTAVNKALTRNSSELASKIVWNLNKNRVMLSPEQERNLFTPVIDSLTLKEIHDAFTKTWAPRHRLILVTGNAKLPSENTTDNTDPKNLIIAAFEKSRMKKVFRPAEKKSIVFPYLPEPEKKGRIIGRKEIPDLGIVQVDFENGLRLNLKKTDFKAEEILATISFGCGRSGEPSDLPGLSALTEEVINESGLGKLKKNEIDQALAGKNTDVFFSVDEERFLFKGRTIPKEVPLLFQLLYAHLIDPGYQEDAYSLSTERFQQKYLALSCSIDGAMELSGNRFLAGEDSRFGLPPYDVFKTLTLNHIRSWIEPQLRDDNLEMSVVGDFDVDFIVKMASKYIGSLPLRSGLNIQKRAKSPEFPVAQSIKIDVETKIPKALVIVAYPTEDLWDINRTRRLNALAKIVSERLREKIRVKLGAAYSTYAYNRPRRAYPGYGVFKAVNYVDPKDSETVVEEVKNIASEIARDGITRDELRRAIDPILTSLKDILHTNDYWLNSVLTGSEKYPQQLNWNRTIMKDYESITENELSSLAKKYLDNSRAAKIIIKPVQPRAPYF